MLALSLGMAIETMACIIFCPQTFLRWQNKLLQKRIFLFLSALSLHSCSSQPRTACDGIYVFQGDGVEDRLELDPDGRFTQKIWIEGTTFMAKGTWTAESNRIKLRDFLVRFDTSSGKVIEPPKKYSVYIGFWDSKRRRISFDEDGAYFVTKSKNRTPAKN